MKLNPSNKQLAADLYVRMVDRGDASGGAEQRLAEIAEFAIHAAEVFQLMLDLDDKKKDPYKDRI